MPLLLLWPFGYEENQCETQHMNLSQRKHALHIQERQVFIRLLFGAHMVEGVQYEKLLTGRPRPRMYQHGEHTS
jgi:hypothetical protein